MKQKSAIDLVHATINWLQIGYQDNKKRLQFLRFLQRNLHILSLQPQQEDIIRISNVNDVINATQCMQNMQWLVDFAHEKYDGVLDVYKQQDKTGNIFYTARICTSVDNVHQEANDCDSITEAIQQLVIICKQSH